MNLIFYLLFRMPWFGYIALGALVVALGQFTKGTTDQRIADIEAAIAAGQPPAVALNAYPGPKQKYNEATVLAQIATSETVRLVDKTNGVKTGEDYMFVLTDPSDTGDLTSFKALMILNKGEYVKFEEWILENTVGFGEMGPIVQINGSVSRSDGEASHAKDALADRGRSAASGMFYVTPYFDGREAALAKSLESAKGQTALLNGIGALVALFGIAKLLILSRIKSLRSNRQQARDLRSDVPDAPQPQ